MELHAYARILLRRWWLPVAFALIAGGVAYAVSMRTAPTYRATAQLSVLPTVVDFFTGEAVQRLLSNYSLQLRSRPFAALVAEEMGPPTTAADVLGKIKAVAAPAEYRIAIEVDDADPRRARDIANAALRAFVEKIRAENAGRERRDIEVQVLDLAEAPGAPFAPRPRRDAAGAALLGAAAGVGTAFLLAYVSSHRPHRPPRRRAGPGGSGGPARRPYGRRRAARKRQEREQGQSQVTEQATEQVTEEVFAR